MDEFFSLNQLADKVGVNRQTVLKYHDLGVIKHDIQTLNSYLFKASRVPELIAAIKDYQANSGINRAIKANIARQRK